MPRPCDLIQSTAILKKEANHPLWLNHTLWCSVLKECIYFCIHRSNYIILASSIKCTSDWMCRLWMPNITYTNNKSDTVNQHGADREGFLCQLSAHHTMKVARLNVVPCWLTTVTSQLQNAYSSVPDKSSLKVVQAKSIKIIFFF